MDIIYPGLSSQKLGYFAAWVTLICFFSTLILRILLTVSGHSDLGGVEQNVVYSIQRLLFDGQIYSDPGVIPFAITQYTPIYHYICGLIARIVGIDPEKNIHQLYEIGRGLNIAINVLLALSVYRLGSKVLKVSSSLSAAMAFACFIFVFRQGYTVRPDSLMDFLLILSVCFFTDYLVNPDQTRKLILASILSILVIFVKQSGIQMPVILAGFLIFVGNWKALKISLITMIAASILLFFGFYLYYGPDLILNVIGGVANGVDTEWFFSYVFGNGFKIKILIPAFVILFITFYRWTIFKADIVTRFLCFCACAMFVFAAVTILKSGSNVAYFFPFLIVSLLLISHLLERQKIADAYQPYLYFSFILYICLVCSLNVFHLFNEVKNTRFINHAQIDEKENTAAEAALFVKNNLKENQYVFANLNDESMIETYRGRRGINNILFRNCLIPQLDIFKSSNVKSGVLGYDNFRKTLLSGQTRYIIESTSHFKFNILPDLQKIKNQNYHLAKQIGPYRIYEYNQN